MGKHKVISLFKEHTLQECFPQLNIMGRSQAVFVECQSYDLVIQVHGAVSHELDIFEDAVLRMIQIQVESTDRLAENLCLPVDMVRLIILRLQEKGYLVDSHTLSPQGNALLGRVKTQEENTVPLMAKLFRIPQTGQILPYVHIGELKPADVVDDTRGFTLEFGSRGEPKIVKGRYVRCEIGQAKRLSQRECVKALQIYNRLAKDRSFPVISALTDWAIDCTAGERVYFHMQAAIQKGNADTALVSDGFVPNIDGLSAYIDQNNADILAFVRSNALEYSNTPEMGDAEKRYRGKYQEIYHELKEIQKMEPSDALKIDDVTHDQIHWVSQKKMDMIRRCAVMIEWAFFYYNAENPISAQLQKELSRGDKASNTAILIELAQKIELRDADKHAQLFARVNAKNIKRMEKTRTPDFYIGFPLALAQCGESGGGLFQRLLEPEMDLLNFLDELFCVYRGLRHGGPKNILSMDPDMIKEKSIKLVCTLLPELWETSGCESEFDAMFNEISDKRLAAHVSLEHAMGSMFFNHMPEDIQDEWIHISPDKTPDQLPDPCHYVNTLYRLLESCMQLFFKEQAVVHQAITRDEGVQIAEQKWGAPLPRTLSTVNGRYFDKVQQGKRVPLGAYALYYMCYMKEHECKKMQELDFVNCIDQILILRGHGNNVGLCVDYDKLYCLRDQVMKITKYLGGF